MKFNKIFIFAAVALAATFASCSDDDDFGPGKPAGKNNVTFAEYSALTIGNATTSFDVTLVRDSSTMADALTVPVQVVNAGIFTVENNNAVFEAGKAETTVTVKVPADMPTNTACPLTLRIPEEYTNSYKDQSTYATYKNYITKEDYAVKYTGKFTDTFLYEDEWDVEIQYSPSQDLYRIVDLFVEGYSIHFKWDATTNVINVTNASGKTLKYWDTGYYLSSYGENIVCYVNQAKFYYDPATKVIHLPFYWYLIKTGGGWGIYEDTITLN